MCHCDDLNILNSVLGIPFDQMTADGKFSYITMIVSRSQTNKIRSLFLFVLDDDLLICNEMIVVAIPSC
jgi:hypothetical protein